ncbi:MAG: Na+/H+ antiporter NhaC family protein, partial [Plesiomonas shigelloides]
MTDNQNNIPARSFAALLPLLVFLTVYIGTGIYYTLQGADFAFYQLPAPVAVLPAIVLSLLLAKEPLNKAINRFIGGVGHPDIIAMCMIYLLAGAFSSVAKATGGVDAAVGLGLSVLPGWALLPGLFLIAAVISTAMGTSMGTIAALSPVALGVAQATGISLPLMAGVILSGAMFGDNMSVISDTTIAATRSQGCLMRDKLKENFRIALPAAIATLILFFFLTRSSEVPAAEPFSWILALPYLVILV